MANFPLGGSDGFLSINETDSEQLSTDEAPRGFDSPDRFNFDVGSQPSNLNVSVVTSTTGISAGQRVDIKIFNDRNQNGVLDSEDRLINAKPNLFSGSFNLRTNPFQHFIAEVTRTAGFNVARYTITASRTASTAPNNLAASEIEMGNVSQDITKRNRVNLQDTADNFSFSIDGNSSLKINVLELGNKKGDVNIRVVRDLDADGVVDRNEVVMKGVGARGGNIDTISGLKGAGDYILQVCQLQGKTKFAVNFDHSAA